jgi:hypothetical protein
MLLAVRPLDQKSICERLQGHPHRIVRWDDCIPS